MTQVQNASSRNGLPEFRNVNGATDAGPVMKMQVDLFDHGKARAVKGGALQPVEEDVTALEHHARAIARETRRALYDPSKHSQDQLRESEYRKLLADRDDHERQAKFADAALRDQENSAAHSCLLDPKPVAPPILVWAAVALIAVTVAPTLHDAVFAFEDDLVAWLVSFAAGILTGAFITWAIVGALDTSGRRTATATGGLIAGVVIGIGLGVVRLGAATALTEILLAVGLTVVELGAVILIEYAATDLRATLAAWGTRKLASDEATAACQAAGMESDRWQSRLSEINGAIRDHISYVETRALQNLKVEDIEDVAVKATLDGYRQGIAENKGKLLGVRR
jgi:hypothetical protein